MVLVFCIVRRFQCTKCNKCFTTWSCLKRHMRIHGEKQSNYLKVRMRTYTRGKEFQCTECNKCFAWCNSLKGHMRMHTMHTDVKEIQCTTKCFH